MFIYIYNLNDILKPNCDYYSKEFTRGTRAYNVTNDKLRAVKSRGRSLSSLKKMYKNNLTNMQIISILKPIFNQYHYSYMYTTRVIYTYIYVCIYMHTHACLCVFNAIIKILSFNYRITEICYKFRKSLPFLQLALSRRLVYPSLKRT